MSKLSDIWVVMRTTHPPVPAKVLFNRVLAKFVAQHISHTILKEILGDGNEGLHCHDDTSVGLMG